MTLSWMSRLATGQMGNRVVAKAVGLGRHSISFAYLLRFRRCLTIVRWTVNRKDGLLLWRTAEDWEQGKGAQESTDGDLLGPSDQPHVLWGAQRSGRDWKVVLRTTSIRSWAEVPPWGRLLMKAFADPPRLTVG